MFIKIFILFVLTLIFFFCFFQAFIGVSIGVTSPIGIWRSKIPNQIFDKWLEELFNDPNIEMDDYCVIGGGHEVWYINGYCGFSFNYFKSHEISYFQKRKFFKRLNIYMHKIRKVQIARWSWRLIKQ